MSTNYADLVKITIRCPNDGQHCTRNVKDASKVTFHFEYLHDEHASDPVCFEVQCHCGVRHTVLLP